jgi:GTP cyclohydrolase I
MNKKKVQDAVKVILQEIGEDLNREGIKFTPIRVARLYENLFYGYQKKLKVMNEEERNTKNVDGIIPITVFKTDKQEMLVRKVNFISTCEHHLASITDGKCWVGIIPDKLLLGMNKIDRIVKYFAARLQLQERMTSQVADWIFENIKPLGVVVVIQANHMCAELQGDNGHFTTSAVRGIFKDVKSAKDEFLEIINL